MKEIYKDLYQFSTYVKPIDLTFHQYLLLGEESMLVHTGNDEQARRLIPEAEALLSGRPLKYIFISHFEADECGGLTSVLEAFPEAVPLCSEVTARQLSGFGFTDKAAVKRPGDKLVVPGGEYEFISYPSEMHRWEGLLMKENTRGIFFSSDLMIRFGDGAGVVIDGDWNDEVQGITAAQVPDDEKRKVLQGTLANFNVKFIATGHGPCVRM